MTTKETFRHRQSTVTVVRKFKVHWRRLSEVSKCVHLPGNPSGIFPLWGICHRKSTQGWGWELGHFRIAHSFCFKERLSAMIFNSHANKFHFHEKGFALSFKSEIFWNLERPICHCFLQTQILWVLCMTSLSHGDKYPGGGRGSTLGLDWDRCVLAQYDVLISYRIYNLLNVLFFLGLTGQSNVHAEVYKCSLHSLHQAKRWLPASGVW